MGASSISMFRQHHICLPTKTDCRTWFSRSTNVALHGATIFNILGSYYGHGERSPNQDHLTTSQTVPDYQPGSDNPDVVNLRERIRLPFTLAHMLKRRYYSHNPERARYFQCEIHIVPNTADPAETYP